MSLTLIIRNIKHLVLMFSLTFLTGCDKDAMTNPSIGNDYPGKDLRATN